MIQLDTSYLIRALVPGSKEDKRIRGWLRAGETLGVSAVGWAEFLCGPMGPAHLELAVRILADRIPFDAETARGAATLFNASGRRRGSLIDCMIAATAIESDAPLATTNPSDFRRFEDHGLRLK